MRDLANWVTAVVLAGAGSACVATSSTPPLSAPNAGELPPTLSAERTPRGTHIYGPQMDLVRDEDGIRGRGPLGPVDLQEGWARNFSGVVSTGSGTTNLHIDPIDNGYLNVNGLFDGKLGELEVRNDRIIGEVGQCHYDLHAKGSDAMGRTYEGFRQCGRWSQAAELTLSPEIGKLAPRDQGAVIALALGR